MRTLKVINNEKGYVKFLFTILVLASLVYVGIKVGMPYYKHSAFKSDVIELARISTDVEKTKEQIIERAHELKIPIQPDDIDITKTEKTLHVKTSWSETVDFLGFYQKTFNFSVDIQE
jgi:predicted membrane protein